MTKNQPKNRNTVVSSVSISKEFEEIIKNNNLSPTEIFRKGLVIEALEREILIPGINMSSETIRGRLAKYRDTNLILEFNNLEQDLLNIESEIAIFRNKLIKIKKEVF